MRDILTRIQVILERVEEKQDQLDAWVNGDKDNPGIKVRIDRLERVVQLGTAILGAIGGAIACGGGYWVWSLIEKK